MKQQHLCMLLGLVFLCTCLQVKAQLKTTQLQDYRPTDQRLRTSYNNLNVTSSNYPIPIEHSNFNYNFFSFLNNEKRQLQHDLQIGVNGANGSLGIFSNYALKHKRFFAKDIFIPFNANIQIDSDFGLKNQAELNLETGIGIGRIDVFNEIDIAERLEDELIRLGLLNSELEDAKLIVLAEKIKELRNVRTLSNRDEVQNELAPLKEALRELGVEHKEVDDETMTKVLVKLAEYEPMVLRKNGFSKSLLFGTGNKSMSSVFLSRIPGTSNISDGYAEFNFEYSKYLNSKWQNTTALSFIYSTISFRDYTERINYLDVNKRAVEFSSTFDYLPNLNTRLSFGLEALYENYDKPIDGLNDFYRVALNVEYEKRLNRNLRLSAGLRVGHAKGRGLELAPSLKLRF